MASVLAALLASGLAAPIAAAAISGPHAATGGMCGLVHTAPVYRHVVVIMEENTSYSGVIRSASAPYINALAGACGVATNYHNITHESLPNYLGLTDGDPLSQLGPELTDCDPGPGCQTAQTSIFSQLGPAGGWRAYQESMPQPCAMTDSGDYAVRHNPPAYFRGLAACARNDVSLGPIGHSRLLRDFSSQATAPRFSLVTPNLCHDMHGADGCPGDPTAAGDVWLSRWLPRLVASRVYRSHNTVVFVVWDEGDSGSVGQDCAFDTQDEGCHVAALVVAPSVPAHTRVATLLNHYSVLRTAEDLLGLPELGSAATAASAAPGFNL
jgi:phosphatidylinositol-3-phosphatase